MKYAVCNEMFECWNTESGFDFARCFAFVAGCGYEGAEIAPFTIAPNITDIPNSKRKEIRRIAEGEGIQITGLHWLLAKTNGYYLTSPDREIRKRTAEYFCELARLCADIGGRFMVLGSPNQRSLLSGVAVEQAEDYAVEVLENTIAVLERNGVKIAVEPLTNKETDFLTTARSAVELINRIGAMEHIALHLDCKAMCGDEEPIPDLIRKYKNELIYFHANDPNLGAPGFGELRFEPILEALCDIGYDGWISSEPFDYTPGVEKIAKDGLDYLKNAEKHGKN